MTEPVSLEDIKQHLVLDAGDTSEDAYLGSLITAARAICEIRTGRQIVGATRQLVLDRFPGGCDWLHLPLIPRPHGDSDMLLTGGTVTSVTISYRDGSGALTTLEPGQYFADLASEPAVLRPVGTWPQAQDRPGALTVSYVVSPLDGARLELARQAIRLIVGHWYANRETVAVDARGGTAELPMAAGWILQSLKVFASS